MERISTLSSALQTGSHCFNTRQISFQAETSLYVCTSAHMYECDHKGCCRGIGVYPERDRETQSKLKVRMEDQGFLGYLFITYLH